MSPFLELILKMGTSFLELSFKFIESIPIWSNNEVPSFDLKIYACPVSKIKSNSPFSRIEFTFFELGIIANPYP